VIVFGFILAKKAEHSIAMMARVLGVSRSGYHAWVKRSPSPRAVADAALTGRIAEIHGESRETYGSPRVHAELRLEDDVRVGKKRIERLMRLAGLSGLHKRRRGRTTIRVQGVRTAPDLVARDFNPTEIDRLWCADITYIRTWEGWLYLASVMDCYSRRIVGWAMADHMRAELVIEALEMAVARRRPHGRPVHHSDQGSQGGLKWSSQQCVVRGTVPSSTPDNPASAEPGPAQRTLTARPYWGSLQRIGPAERVSRRGGDASWKSHAVPLRLRSTRATEKAPDGFRPDTEPTLPSPGPVRKAHAEQ